MKKAPIEPGHVKNPYGLTKPDWTAYAHDALNPPHYYRKFSSLDGAPEDIPVRFRTRIQCVVICLPDGRRHTWHHADVYAVDFEGKWTETNEAGILTYAEDNTPLQAIHRGLWINYERFLYILNIASNDPDYPEAMAYEPAERSD